MKIVTMNELIYAEPKPTTVEERQKRHDHILAEMETPIYLGTCSGVAYDNKSDRYAATFVVDGGKKLVLKTPDEVAAFLAEHVGKVGYWVGRMDAGKLVDVNLIQAG